MIFRKALVRLTLNYTLTQLTLFAVFALSIYSYVTSAFDFDIADNEKAASVNAAEQGFANLRVGLIVGYGFLIVVVPIVSYFMAKAAIKPIRKSYEAQQRFLDGAAHELRTPLSIIQGELELALSRSRTVREYREALSESLEATHSLIRLSNDLLLLGGEPSQLPARYQKFSLSTLLVSMSESGSFKSSRLVWKVASDIEVLGSSSLIERAVSNLIENSLKYDTTGAEVEVSLNRYNHDAIIRVRDRGPGMSAEHVSTAFDRFWRAPESQNVSGHGLGLSIVQEICRAHRGKAVIESTLGQGTTVTLQLPIA